jgi:hypothetical protein
MLICCVTTGIVRGRARSGRLRCECVASGVVGLGSTQVGLTTNGSWRCGIRASASRARLRRMKTIATMKSTRKAAPPRDPPSSAPSSWLGLFSRMRRERSEIAVHSAGEGEACAVDIGDVADAIGGVVDGGRNQLGGVLGSLSVRVER